MPESEILATKAVTSDKFAPRYEQTSETLIELVRYLSYSVPLLPTMINPSAQRRNNATHLKSRISGLQRLVSQIGDPP